MTPYDLVTSKVADLTGPSQAGGNFRCPAHEDSTASLTITDGGKGVLMTCHAGCELSVILEELGMSQADLFNERLDSNQDKPTHTDTYDYVDADGELVFQVLRYHPKSFRQRRPNGRGGWVSNLKGIERPLYNLPAVLSALDFDETVWLVEGEKDADAGIRAGLVATTKSSGATGWPEEYSQVLADGNVHVVADDDEPGRAYAFDVAKSLTAAGCSVRVFAPLIGKDLADHLGAGKSIEELVEIFEPSAMVGLPPQFWMETPQLAMIRQFAHSQFASPDALLGALFARLSSIHRSGWLLDTTFGPLASLSTYAALVGRSGSGKSVATALAKELLPLKFYAKTRDGLAIGSGEGLVEAYLAVVTPKTPPEVSGGSAQVGDKYQAYSGVYGTLDEGQKLAKHGSRSGSTLMETLRTFWIGSSDPGQANATADRSRSLKPGTYSLGVTIGIQPEHASAILDDSAGGTPQRFIWFTLADPTTPRNRPPKPEIPAWRPPQGNLTLDQTIIDEWEQEKYEIAAGLSEIDPLDSHRTMAKTKVAALLTLLHGELHIGPMFWELAEVVMQASTRVRSSVIEGESERRRRKAVQDRRDYAAKEVEASTAVFDSAVERATVSSRTSVVNYLRRKGSASRTELGRCMSSKNRALIPAIDLLTGMLDDEIISISGGDIADRGCTITLVE